MGCTRIKRIINSSFTEKPETQRLSLVWLNTTSYIQSALEIVGGGSKADRRKKAEHMNLILKAGLELTR